MSNFGPPGSGASDPWGGRRPGDGYPPEPHHPGPGPGGQQYAPPTEQFGAEPYGRPPSQYGPPVQRYEPTPGWPAGPPPSAAPHQGYPADRGYAGQPSHTGEQSPYAGQPPYPEQQPYAGGQPPYPGPQPYDEPPPRRRGKGVLLLVVIVLAVLLGGAGAYWLFGRDGESPTSGTTAATAPAADPDAADPTAAVTPSDAADATPSSAAPASSTDPRFVKAGQCVANEGGSGQPKLVIADCAPKTYEVLRRVDGATSGKKDAEAKCGKVAGYTDWYFFDSELDTLDFVLCLKRR
ncbi:flagellar basal body protein FliL [Micromonospora sp. WMMD975]|uniref:LppU/SCO3897 family protein n=1 Tax=Micromonospora sp. WMMD975 TaxID=3016087 RepID=UPI00249A7555|nr:flagellar basal body protein FliL [Micromonospora sp. WMMD975]WFE32856.1 flagellar basal body protein FliL [Micromonospora sp. WMMD975]